MSRSLDLDWLRAELKKPGRSQTELARFLGLHVSAVNKILSASRSVKLGEYEKIVEYLKSTAKDKREFSLPSRTFPESTSHDIQALGEIEWTLQRTAKHPPGSEVNLDRQLLGLLTSGDERGFLAISSQLLLEELAKCIFLQMKRLNDRETDRLNDYLNDIDLSIVLGKGLGILEGDDGRQLKALYSAFTMSIAHGEYEMTEGARENIRRAASSHLVEGDERMWLRLAKFVTDLFERLVDHQIARRDSILAAVGMSYDDVEGAVSRARSPSDRKSKNDA